MDKFHLILSPKAVKDLNVFSDALCTRITSGMKVLEVTPFPKGKLIKKIKGTKSALYRLGIDKYRIFYLIDANKVVILRILSKKDAERFIQNLN